MHHAPERADVRRRRVNAHADDWKLGPRTPHRLRIAKAAREGRLNHEGLEAVKHIALGSPPQDGRVPDSCNHVGEEPLHLVVFVSDHDRCHELTIVVPQRFSVRARYGLRMSARRILVLDDDSDIRDLLRVLLERAGFSVEEAADGKAGLRAFYATSPDLVLLDVSMPELDGWKTLERIRDLSDVPVIMLSARSAELEKVRALQAGADDYVTKPFGRQELLARVEAVLRRPTAGRSEGDERYADGLVSIDFGERSVSVRGERVSLTPLEFRLLTTFVRNPNQVLSAQQLLELVWGDPYALTADKPKIYVGYLRQKLGIGSDGATPLETVRGFGYCYRPPSL
jgi:DNA-binding response OmpR family regulator